MLPDYYAVLRIQPNASPQEVRSSYRRLAKEHHHDIGGSLEKLRALQEAYGVLSDPVRRRQYDAQRKAHLPPAASAEPLIPAEPLRPEPFRASGFPNWHPGDQGEDLDRLFQEFEEFF